jgi:hypothetical protein
MARRDAVQLIVLLANYFPFSAERQLLHSST